MYGLEDEDIENTIRMKGWAWVRARKCWAYAGEPDFIYRQIREVVIALPDIVVYRRRYRRSRKTVEAKARSEEEREEGRELLRQAFEKTGQPGGQRVYRRLELDQAVLRLPGRNGKFIVADVALELRVELAGADRFPGEARERFLALLSLAGLLERYVYLVLANIDHVVGRWRVAPDSQGRGGAGVDDANARDAPHVGHVPVAGEHHIYLQLS